MIDIRKLKELVRLMVSNDLTEIDLRDSEEQVTLRRSGPQPPQVSYVPVNSVPTGVAVASPADNGAAPVAGSSDALAAAAARAEDDAGLLRIASPMVGTFYASPNPDAQPFINVGDRVHSDTVVCIVEAMKIFNEIKAECTGTIERVLVKSGDPVEFGEALFLVRPE